METGRQNPRILNRHDSALGQKRQGRVRRIPHDCNIALGPSFRNGMAK